MGRVIVAFSGGTDSAYLAWAAGHVLGAGALAMTADSATLPESHKRDAEAFVERFGIAHEYVRTLEFENPDYVKNDPNRCFHCKDELFTRLEEAGRERGFEHIVYGVNLDDLGDYRPGPERRAATPGGRAAGRRRDDEGRHPRVVAPGGPAHLGPSGFRLPELADSLRHAGHRSRP